MTKCNQIRRIALTQRMHLTYSDEPCVPTKGYTSRCCAIRRVQVTEEATACGRTNHSPQSKEQSSERLGDTGAYKGGDDLP